MTQQCSRDANHPSWFARLFGVEESSYPETQRLFELRCKAMKNNEEQLIAPNGRCFRPGLFETPSLGELRLQVAHAGLSAVDLQLQNVVGDVREMHSHLGSAGAVFQVASQFNCLEFLTPGAAPEDGITDYELDHTQGPSCALACAASTVWRNYFMTFADSGTSLRGQTRTRQINNLIDVLPFFDGDVLEVRNGYTFSQDVEALAARVDAMDEGEKDAVRAAVRVGVQWNAEVTDETFDGQPAGLVTQVFCSALSLGSSPKLRLWRSFAQLILDAAYEATLSLAAINLSRHGCRDVYLTLLGGGAFGNGPRWIEEALLRALRLHCSSGLRVFIVHKSERTPWMNAYTSLASKWGAFETLQLKDGIWLPLSSEEDSDSDQDENVQAA